MKVANAGGSPRWPRRARWITAAVLLLGGPALPAAEIPEREMLQPPTSERVRVLLESPDDLTALEEAARAAGFQAAAARRSAAMEGWLLLARWFRLLAEPEAEATKRFVLAINTAQLGHPNMPQRWDLSPQPLSRRLRPETALQLLSHGAFSRSFFAQLSPYDHLPHVLAVLDELATADPASFQQYHQLALAIALVSDVPPPPDWPHRQVSPEALPRRLPPPLAAFAFWTASDRQRRTLHRLTQLPAAELKYLVSTVAPVEELQWARQHAPYTLQTLPAAYDSVGYRTDRVEQNQLHWPRAEYDLPVIQQEGGICVDQAYFAAEVGKAWGVPTLLFNGAGRDGRHAWFGYLDAGQRWRLDVGRYAEQRYIVGVAIDPQTWDEVTDHELAFLTERFRQLPSFQQSRAQLVYAEELLRLDQIDAAVAAARAAVNHERRHAAAWDVLLSALEAQGAAATVREAVQRDAARAFQRYPDLQARYLREVIVSLRTRGQESAAAHEERLLAQRYVGARADLAAAQAAELLLRSLAQDRPERHLRMFERSLRQFGPDAGMLALDRLVRPFVAHLRSSGRDVESRQALRLAREVLSVAAGSQFDRELRKLERSAP